MYTDTMEKITDHEFTAFFLGPLATPDYCVICGEVETDHEYEYDGDYPNGPERDTLDLYGIERFELGE